MEESNVTTGKFALTYGAILGITGVIFSLMLFSMDMHYQGGIAVLGVSLLLMFIAIFVGIFMFKKANNGCVNFGQGLKVGVGIALIAGIIGIAFNFVITTTLDPDMMDKARVFQKEQLLASTKMTSEQIDTQLEMGKKFSTPSMQIIFGLLYSIVAGFILSLIPALALKKDEILY